MTDLWRVGWVEDGETYYSIPLDDKKAVGELCKSVEAYPAIIKTADVWIEHADIDWKRIVGKS